MKKCLVTGGAGFIGSHLVDRLISEGHQVIVIDNLSSTKHKKNLNPKAFFVHDDILNTNMLTKVFNDDIDIIFHLAAIPSVQQSISQPSMTNDVNVQGTHNLLMMAKNFKVEKFIFASSSSIYGNQKTLPLVETMKPNPLSPYSLHKLIGEHYCELYHNLYGLKTVSLRYFNVFGPRQNPNGDYACLIPKIINALNTHNSFEIFGDGTQTRDFCYIDDVVESNMVAAFSNNDLWGQTINVGSGKSHSVNEIVSLVQQYLKSDSKIKHGPKVIESQDTLADTTKMAKLLFAPNNKFKENLKKTIDWFG